MHGLKPFIVLDIGQHLKHVTARFRLGISDIMVHRLRYKVGTYNELLCPLCKQEEENEVHFVLRCVVLRDVRESFLKPKYYRQPSLFKLNLLMSSSVAEVVRNFALYLYRAFKFRELALS